MQDADDDLLPHVATFRRADGAFEQARFQGNGFFRHVGAETRAAGVNPLQHYHDFGWREGRDPSAAFDTQGYLVNNPDVAAANIDPLEHYLMFGIYEGRVAVNDGVWH